MSLYIKNNYAPVTHIESSKVTINQGSPNPISVEEQQPMDIEDVEPEIERKLRRRGPKKQNLFRDNYDKKDEVRTQEEAERIKRYISEHHLGGKQSELDSSTTSRMNRVVAMFWQHWREREWVNEEFEGAPFYRFLTKDCGLICPVEEKPFVRAVRRIIESGRIPEIYANVADLFDE